MLTSFAETSKKISWRTNMIRGKFNTIRRLFRATSIDRDDEAG